MLLLARAANDAAEPWGFSNFCIVAHPCAGHKKSRKIMTTRIAGGLLLGYNPWKADARLKTPAFTVFRPDCP